MGYSHLACRRDTPLPRPRCLRYARFPLQVCWRTHRGQGKFHCPAIHRITGSRRIFQLINDYYRRFLRRSRRCDASATYRGSRLNVAGTTTSAIYPFQELHRKGAGVFRVDETDKRFCMVGAGEATSRTKKSIATRSGGPLLYLLDIGALDHFFRFRFRRRSSRRGLRRTDQGSPPSSTRLLTMPGSASTALTSLFRLF